MRTRTAQTLEWVTTQNWLFDIALDCLSLGCAWLLQAQQENGGAIAQAEEFLKRAIDGLRQAGRQDHLPRGLLTRAACFRLRGSIDEADGYDRARADLDEAFALATHGDMRLHLADCHLESARLALALGEMDKASDHWRQARDLIAQTGYHRRDGELAEIEARLKTASITE